MWQAKVQLLKLPKMWKFKEFYSVGEFEKVITLPDRTEAMTKKLAEIFFRKSYKMEKEQLMVSSKIFKS
ncbi:type I restriction enzyme, R subunit [Methanofervidicoccus abyssi]|uniref:Type I restriction enzyme, R subunit n=1 Tax=Methanofervidicoccus abyssi TaxID=2082189 RepID=A0A401HRJ8_9EURY|nr:hypothetical protein [Methanofervidicoccus abyssi]GBF36878.1 type I restriction enzyme, R subunit [Methanofervidicoccus abyssi]